MGRCAFQPSRCCCRRKPSWIIPKLKSTPTKRRRALMQAEQKLTCKLAQKQIRVRFPHPRPSPLSSTQTHTCMRVCVCVGVRTWLWSSSSEEFDLSGSSSLCREATRRHHTPPPPSPLRLPVPLPLPLPPAPRPAMTGVSLAPLRSPRRLRFNLPSLLLPHIFSVKGLEICFRDRQAGRLCTSTHTL